MDLEDLKIDLNDEKITEFTKLQWKLGELGELGELSMMDQLVKNKNTKILKTFFGVRAGLKYYINGNLVV